MDPLTWAGAGSFLSGAGSVLGGLGIGGGEKRPRASDAVKYLLGTKTDKNGKPISYSKAQGIHQSNMFTYLMQSGKDHGIHPLAMMGFQPAATPQIPVMSPESNSWNPSEIGQGVHRAASAFKSEAEREMQELALERERLSNDYLKTQIAGSVQRIAQQGLPPSVSSGVGANLVDGQPSSGTVQPQPTQPYMSGAGGPHGEAGSITDVGYVRTSPTTLAKVMSKDMKERAEDDIFQQAKWHARHSIPIVRDLYNFKNRPPYPHEIPPPKGYKSWVFYGNEWHASKKAKK